MVSVRESCEAVGAAGTALLAEFWLQLTTVSWLSVRRVPRPPGPPPAPPPPQSAPTADLAASLLGWLWGGAGGGLHQHQRADSGDGGQELNKAEERVRLAAELVAKNNRARARLVLTEIVRYYRTEKTGLDILSLLQEI